MLSSLIALVVMLVSSVNASNPADCDRPLYSVVHGDTCDSICSTNSVSNYQLTLVNPEIDANCDNLGEAGVTTLCLGRRGQNCRDTHTVTGGETCSWIAENAGITVDLLVKNNPNLGTGGCVPRQGQTLCVAKTAIPYTPNP